MEAMPKPVRPFDFPLRQQKKPLFLNFLSI